MAGRFEGLSDLEWKLFEDIFPNEPKKRGKGMPHAPYRHVLNSMLYILITGCRWCDLPRGNVWASKSSSHRWLKRWRSDGTFEYIQGRVLAMPAAGYTYPGKGGGEEVAYGGKGKGVLIHTLTEGSGMPLANCTTPANGNE
ncbi:MAG: transposase, partial [Nostoc indistinguendum CM1-VF10]|nr:transposase [Nostoc indistinguendum CM1-VF10]